MTKPNFEKPLASQLRGAGVPYFLPLTERFKTQAGQRRRVRRPLFPGYLFFAGENDARYTAITSGKIIRLIDARDQEKLRRELLDLSRAIAEDPQLDSHVVSGEKYKVMRGAWEGYSGTVETETGKAFVLLYITILNQVCPLEIEPELLEAV